MSLEFNGTEIWVYGAKRGNHGNYSGAFAYTVYGDHLAYRVVSLDGSGPVTQSGMIPDPGTYQSVLYQATGLNANTPHHIQVTNLPGKSPNPMLASCTSDSQRTSGPRISTSTTLSSRSTRRC